MASKENQPSLDLEGDEQTRKIEASREETVTTAVEPERTHVDLTEDGPVATGTEIVARERDESVMPPAVKPAGLREAALALPVGEMIVALQEYDERREIFRNYVNAKMVQGVHYGVPPGVNQPKEDASRYRNRPSLYKPGADLVLDLCHVRAVFEPDRESWEMNGSVPGSFFYICRIVGMNGETLGEGRGACSADGEKAKTDLVNASVKKAQKRAKVDAVINTFCLSDLFTQDLERPVKFGNPAKDGAAPEIETREERTAYTDRERVAQLVKNWQSHQPKGVGSREDWFAFVQETTGREFHPGHVSEWTPDDIEAVSTKLGEWNENRISEDMERGHDEP